MLAHTHTWTGALVPEGTETLPHTLPGSGHRPALGRQRWGPKALGAGDLAGWGSSEVGPWDVAAARASGDLGPGSPTPPSPPGPGPQPSISPGCGSSVLPETEGSGGGGVTEALEPHGRFPLRAQLPHGRLPASCLGSAAGRQQGPWGVGRGRGWAPHRSPPPAPPLDRTHVLISHRHPTSPGSFSAAIASGHGGCTSEVRAPGPQGPRAPPGPWLPLGVGALGTGRMDGRTDGLHFQHLPLGGRVERGLGNQKATTEPLETSFPPPFPLPPLSPSPSLPPLSPSPLPPSFPLGDTFLSQPLGPVPSRRLREWNGEGTWRAGAGGPPAKTAPRKLRAELLVRAAAICEVGRGSCSAELAARGASRRGAARGAGRAGEPGGCRDTPAPGPGSGPFLKCRGLCTAPLYSFIEVQ